MSLLDMLSDEKVWIDFYERKVDPIYFRISDAQVLFKFIREKRYVPIVDGSVSFSVSTAVDFSL